MTVSSSEVNVDPVVCDLCGRCVRYCPADLLRVVDRRVVVKYPGECWVCGVCVVECHLDCIEPQFAFLAEQV